MRFDRMKVHGGVARPGKAHRVRRMPNFSNEGLEAGARLDGFRIAAPHCAAKPVTVVQNVTKTITVTRTVAKPVVAARHEVVTERVAASGDPIPSRPGVFINYSYSSGAAVSLRERALLHMRVGESLRGRPEESSADKIDVLLGWLRSLNIIVVVSGCSTGGRWTSASLDLGSRVLACNMFRSRHDEVRVTVSTESRFSTKHGRGQTSGWHETSLPTAEQWERACKQAWHHFDSEEARRRRTTWTYEYASGAREHERACVLHVDAGDAAKVRDQLNSVVVIGDRGSGKTSHLRSVRFCLPLHAVPRLDARRGGSSARDGTSATTKGGAGSRNGMRAAAEALAVGLDPFLFRDVHWHGVLSPPASTHHVPLSYERWYLRRSNCAVKINALLKRLGEWLPGARRVERPADGRADSSQQTRALERWAASGRTAYVERLFPILIGTKAGRLRALTWSRDTGSIVVGSSTAALRALHRDERVAGAIDVLSEGHSRWEERRSLRGSYTLSRGTGGRPLWQLPDPRAASSSDHLRASVPSPLGPNDESVAAVWWPARGSVLGTDEVASVLRVASWQASLMAIGLSRLTGVPLLPLDLERAATLRVFHALANTLAPGWEHGGRRRSCLGAVAALMDADGPVARRRLLDCERAPRARIGALDRVRPSAASAATGSVVGDGVVYNELVRFLRRLVPLARSTHHGGFVGLCGIARGMASSSLLSARMDLCIEVAVVVSVVPVGSNELRNEALRFIRMEPKRVEEYLETFPEGERYSGFRRIRFRRAQAMLLGEDLR